MGNDHSYGRNRSHDRKKRRIGKTYLVKESFEHKFTFQHTGISNNQIEPGTRKMAQLNKFAESLKEAGYKRGNHDNQRYSSRRCTI